MPRNRMIKPEFWDDEKLATQTSRDARLLFIGMWNYSDDYGVVKGNPAWLKNHVFPYDDALSIKQFKSWLSELEAGRWIIPFESTGEQFYLIRKFSTHQTITRPSETRNPSPPEGLSEGSVRAHGGLSDEIEIEVKKNIGSEDPVRARDIRAEKIVSIYREKCPTLPPVKKLTKPLKDAITARCKEAKDRQATDWWERYFAEDVATSDFLMGRKTDWQANLQWLVGPKNMAKVLAGNYVNRNGDAKTRARPDGLDPYHVTMGLGILEESGEAAYQRYCKKHRIDPEVYRNANKL